MLDADERISSELRTEIDQALDAKSKSANLPELSSQPRMRRGNPACAKEKKFNANLANWGAVMGA
jgi:hypothetical protein